MNCSSYYAEADVTAPLLPDNPRVAKPSDHKVPIARPLALSSQPQCNVYRTKTCRPLPDSAVRTFMQWIHTQQWDTVPIGGSTTAQVAAYQKVVQDKVDQLFPEKTIRITNKDKEFITAELKLLDRKKKREWTKNGRSDLYIRLRKDFKRKYKTAASNYLKKCVSDLKVEHPGKAAATLKRMGAQPGDCLEGGSFTLLNHLRDNLTVEQQLERLSDYFVSVSQEFPPPRTGPVVCQYSPKVGTDQGRGYSPSTGARNIPFARSV